MGDRLLDLGVGGSMARCGASVGLAQTTLRRALDLRGRDHRALGGREGHGLLFRKLVSGLGAGEVGPSSLSTDSQSARDVSYNPQHHDRMKHVQRRHFFVRDMVESFELEVPFVRTADNVADMFTKPMKSATPTSTSSGASS